MASWPPPLELLLLTWMRHITVQICRSHLTEQTGIAVDDHVRNYAMERTDYVLTQIVDGMIQAVECQGDGIARAQRPVGR